MAKSLIIVESPAKAKTIERYLGGKYLVKASLGHIKDLPKNRLGIDIEGGFTPQYEIIKGKGKIVAGLKSSAREIFNSGGSIFLAQDPDREGEAIAWHIAEEIDGGNGNVYRVLFHEITKDAVKKAIEDKLRLDRRKYDAQIARRILDRLVGYQVSPILWEKVKRGLSAGRVQSVALRLICEREKEIRAFCPEEFWSITGEFLGDTLPSFNARLVKIDGKKVELKNFRCTEGVLKALKKGRFSVANVEKRERQKDPPPPFITSTLQQEAAKTLRFSVKKTMMIAQQLYEGIELGKEGPIGLITYMRTDSTRLSSHAVEEARGFIKANFGDNFLPSRPRVYLNKKTAQDAHEAVRPTGIKYTPQTVKPFLTNDQCRLYELIWNRFISCQMNPAIIDQTTVNVEGVGEGIDKYLFQSIGSVVRFPGFTILHAEGGEEGKEDEKLPPLRKGDSLRLLNLIPKQHFTQPPPRYSEGTLVKELEEKGIGRPSTYAVILTTIQAREYVNKDEGRFVPTELGMLVSDLLVENFPKILNVDFTARMEDDLDEIEEGKTTWLKTVEDFYGNFKGQVERAKKEMRDVKKEEIQTDIPCERCRREMVIKWGRNGRFLACPQYPDCKNTKDIVFDKDGKVRVVEEKKTEDACPTCGKPMVIKDGRFGRFLACSAYPECKTTRSLPTGVRCPEDKCSGMLVERMSKKGRIFFSCSNYPSCKYSLWERPVAQECPECGHPFLIEKSAKKVKGEDSKPASLRCPNKVCLYNKK